MTSNSTRLPVPYVVPITVFGSTCATTFSLVRCFAIADGAEVGGELRHNTGQNRIRHALASVAHGQTISAVCALAASPLPFSACRVPGLWRALADYRDLPTFCHPSIAALQPGNEGRDYVLRRVLRRAVRYGRQTLSAPVPSLRTPVLSVKCTAYASRPIHGLELRDGCGKGRRPRCDC